MPDVAHVDGEHAAAALDDGRAAEQLGDARAVDRGRHREHAQLGRDVPLRVEREREADVGVQAALVKLVEQHGRDAFERRVALQHPREHAFGDDLDARAFADARLEPHAVADGVADALAERGGHALGDGARREPARLEHHDALAARPRLLEQRERHDGALAGAGRRNDDGVRPARSAAASGARASSIGRPERIVIEALRRCG